NDGDKERAARIESAADKISRAAADTTKLESTARKGLTAALSDFETKVASIGEAIAQRTAESLSSKVEACIAGLDAKIDASIQAAEKAVAAPKHELVPISLPVTEDRERPEKKRRKASAAPVEQPA